jgi:hypothetical protein
MRIRDPRWKSSDPGSGMRDGKKSDPGSGINIPDPQHWKKIKKKFSSCKLLKFLLIKTLDPDPQLEKNAGSGSAFI